MLRTAALFSSLLLLAPTYVSALGANSQTCNQLYNLPSNTVAQGVDQSGNMSQTACDAYQYLYSISTKRDTADLAHVTRLNNTFAICAANFFKAYTQKYGGSLQITSTWRSDADQKRVSSSPTSNHTRGLAIDVHPSDSNYDRLRDFAAANKQFGVCFARPTYNGGPDLPHMTAAGIGSNTEDCNKYGISKLCDEGGTFDPNAVNEAVPLGNSAQTPTSDLSNMLRQYLGGQSGQSGATGATGAVPANNSIPASSQPFSSTQSGTIAQPSTSGSTGSTGATTAGGTSQTTAVPATIATGNTAQPANVSDQLTTSQPSGSSNAYDLLNALANPTTTKTASTGTPLALNGSLYQSQQLTQTQVQYDANGQPIALNGSLSNVSALGPNGQQTFTSQDLQYTQSNSYVAPTNSSFAARTLESLKQALLKFLAALQPFGYLRQTSAEAAE